MNYADAFLNLFETDAWARLVEYFFSAYENTLFELGIFCSLLFAVFCVRNFLLKRAIVRARREIPLVIGGWGTRGKSSVERLKASIFSAMGYGVLSKTTGCEAMFLHADAYGGMREMFIFRPYDKATIWEQHNMTRLARNLGADVFLWECMGLSPEYVNILQKHWMGDDLSTITNTYPDHEDIQGPAGIDIPRVMVNFIPKKSTVVSSEEQMLPVLKEGADMLKTRIVSVGWLEAGLIADDVLKRFSYEEHPYNIALVAAAARELGIEEDFVLKEIADHVIPDIGVLKVYPPASLKTATMEFASGNSANERFGALGNWKRTGFDLHRLEKDPRIRVCTVVNNRADRVPRSRVFARILVEDIAADLHFLIGSNLSGLYGYINESLDEYVEGLTLWPESENKAAPPEIFRETAASQRIVFDHRQVKAKLKAMLSGATENADVERLTSLYREPEKLREGLRGACPDEIADRIVRFLKKDLERSGECESFARKLHVANPNDRAGLDSEYRNLYRRWFLEKIAIVHDYYADGNRIVHRIREENPPGLYCRIMGLQNIKGTGLDFVYSWQRWERCHDACELMESGEPEKIHRGLRELAAFQEYNILCEERVRGTIARVRSHPALQAEKFQAELTMILSNMENALSRISLKSGDGAGKSPLTRLLGLVESFQDAADAVKRRKIADRIYKDLVDERIAPQRAAMELQELNKRQKGGWLVSKLKSRGGF